jgi:hypothetical protein
MSDDIGSAIGLALVLGVVGICFFFYYIVYKTVNCMLKRNGESNFDKLLLSLVLSIRGVFREV